MEQVLRDVDVALNGKSAKYIEIEQLLQECTRLGCTDATKTCQKLLEDMSVGRNSCLETLNSVVGNSRYERGGYGAFYGFQGYAPSSLPTHQCETPSIETSERFQKEFLAGPADMLAQQEAERLKSTSEWSRKLARCAKARNPQCCSREKSRRLKGDTGRNPRRWLVKRILLAIQSLAKSQKPNEDINLFPIEPIAVPEKSENSGKASEKDGLKVEPFAASRYRLPAGDQFRLTRHCDAFCSHDTNLFTVRAQYNCFCCRVHEDYGSVQLRQLYCAPLKPSTAFDKYAALTDGVTFRFVRARFNSGRDAPYEEYVHFDIETELADILHFGRNLLLAALSSSSPSSSSSHAFPPLSIALHSSIENVLACGENNVVQLRHENGCRFILKYFNKGFMREAEPSIHFATEVATIRSLASNTESFYNKPELCRSIVKQVLVDTKQGTFLVSEYIGESLFSFCFCKSVLAWKIVVETHISSALRHLHSLGFAFVDLHPGNIVCREDGEEKSAKLIDLESLTPLTQQKVTCRVMQAFMPPGPLVPSTFNDFASLQLVLAWMDNTHRYRQIAYNSDYFSREQHDSIKWKIIHKE